MSVMNRKLFADRAARNTLRNMGGIMGSYPELIQEAQAFNNGGMVTIDQWRNMTRSERQAAGLPTSELGAQMYFNRFGVGMGRNDPQTGALLPEAVSMEEAAQGEFGGLPPIMTEPAGTIEPDTEYTSLGDIGYSIAETLGFGPAMEAAGVERPRDVRRQEAEAAALAEQMEQQTVAEDEAAAEAAAEEEPVQVQNQPLEVNPELLANPDETSDDLRSKYEERLKLFQEVLGGADEQTAQDKAMQLAMIGLAIASGQSPNALTNIAQGALVGLQAMSEQEAARRAQDRELRAAALESAMEEANRGAVTEEDISDYYARLYETGISDAPSAGVTDPLDAAAYADDLARQGVFDRFGIRLPSRRSPGSELTASPQQLEDAAREAGETEFVYNGMRYPVRPR